MNKIVIKSNGETKYTIQPAIEVSTGPGNRPVEFQSGPGNGPSSPIVISFATPVQSFSVDVISEYGYAGSEIVGYDESGQVAASSIIESEDEGQSPPAYRMSVRSQRGFAEIVRVDLLPPQNTYVAYKNISTVPVIEIVKNSIPTLAGIDPQLPVPPTPQTVDLNNIIQLSGVNTARTYVKNSMTHIPSHEFLCRNVSSIYDVWIELSTVPGISLSETSFLLLRGDAKQITMTFDVTRLNMLPEGTSQITLPIRLSSKVKIVTTTVFVPTAVQPIAPAVDVGSGYPIDFITERVQ